MDVWFYSRIETAAERPTHALNAEKNLHRAPPERLRRAFCPGLTQTYHGCRRTGNWLRSVNLDTINLLDEVAELSAWRHGRSDAAFQRALRSLREREARGRQEFLREASCLRAELEGLPAARKLGQFTGFLGSRGKVAKQVAAALLAIGLPAPPDVAKQGPACRNLRHRHGQPQHKKRSPVR